MDVSQNVSLGMSRSTAGALTLCCQVRELLKKKSSLHIPQDKYDFLFLDLGTNSHVCSFKEKIYCLMVKWCKDNQFYSHTE